MSYYSLFVDITNKNCYVIGGGEVAQRKVNDLVNAGADVSVISPSLTVELEKLKAGKQITHINREYRAKDIEDAYLVISATNDLAVNKAVCLEAKSKGIFVNVVDNPKLSNFIVPAKVERGDLKIAISTSGKIPALAAKIREDLEKQYGPEYSDYVERLSKIRDKVIAKYADNNKRKQVLSDIVRKNSRKKLEECI